jgi:hypothetical protein
MGKRRISFLEQRSPLHFRFLKQTSDDGLRVVAIAEAEARVYLDPELRVSVDDIINW